MSCGVTDDDTTIEYLVNQYLPAYSGIIASCQHVLQHTSCGDENYGGTIRKHCPCSCNDQTMEFIGSEHHGTGIEPGPDGTYKANDSDNTKAVKPRRGRKGRHFH